MSCIDNGSSGLYKWQRYEEKQENKSNFIKNVAIVGASVFALNKIAKSNVVQEAAKTVVKTGEKAGFFTKLVGKLGKFKGVGTVLAGVAGIGLALYNYADKNEEADVKYRCQMEDTNSGYGGFGYYNGCNNGFGGDGYLRKGGWV
jgi:hypothetical protein